MENVEIFEFDELKHLFGENEMFLSLDIRDVKEGFVTNIIENKSVYVKNIPNTFEEIGKKYWCENKIKKFLKEDRKYNYEFISKLKLEKKGVFEFSVTLKL